MNPTYSDQEKFEEELAEILKNHRGEYALYSSGERIGFYASYDEAYEDALSRLGSDGRFLIQEVTENSDQPISIAWEAGVAFG